MNTLYYFNPLFDLQLGGYPTNKVKRSSEELSLLFSFMGERSDSVIADVIIPDDWVSYLQSIGIDTSPITTPVSEHLTGVPWGWDKDAISTFLNAKANFQAPDLLIVKKANSRKFCNDISLEYGFGVPDSYFFENVTTYLSFLDTIKNYPLVVKPAFGGSGFGFKFIENPEQGKSMINDITHLISHGGAIIEPWCKRIYDISSTVVISQDGTFGPIRHQRFYSNEFGAFYAIYLSPEDKILDSYKGKQEKAVFQAAQELYKLGYFGTAGFDSFVYRNSDNQENLAAVIEINARHSMSDIAHAIRNKYAQNRFCFFRLISKKRCILPDNYQAWIELLGPNHFNPSTKEGVLLVSPLRFCYNKTYVQPGRNALFLSAKSENELFKLDLELRNLIEKKFTLH